MYSKITLLLTDASDLSIPAPVGTRALHILLSLTKDSGQGEIEKI